MFCRSRFSSKLRKIASSPLEIHQAQIKTILQSQTKLSPYVRQYCKPSLEDEESKEPTPAIQSKILENIHSLNNSNQKIDETMFNNLMDLFPSITNKRFFLQAILEKENRDLITGTTDTHNAMLEKCTEFGWREEAEILFQRLKDFGKADNASYTFMICLYAKMKDVDVALANFEELCMKSDNQENEKLSPQESEKSATKLSEPRLQPTLKMYTVLIEMYLDLKKYKEAEILFEFMQTRMKPSVSLSMRMLFRYHQSKKVLKATTIINDLFMDKSLNINAKLYSRLILFAVDMKHAKTAADGLRLALEKNIIPEMSETIFQVIFILLRKDKSHQEALDLFNLIKKLGIKPRFRIYLMLMDTYATLGMIEEAKGILLQAIADDAFDLDFNQWKPQKNFHIESITTFYTNHRKTNAENEKLKKRLSSLRYKSKSQKSFEKARNEKNRAESFLQIENEQLENESIEEEIIFKKDIQQMMEEEDALYNSSIDRLKEENIIPSTINLDEAKVKPDEIVHQDQIEGQEMSEKTAEQQAKEEIDAEETIQDAQQKNEILVAEEEEDLEEFIYYHGKPSEKELLSYEEEKYKEEIQHLVEEANLSEANLDTDREEFFYDYQEISEKEKLQQEKIEKEKLEINEIIEPDKVEISHEMIDYDFGEEMIEVNMSEDQNYDQSVVEEIPKALVQEEAQKPKTRKTRQPKSEVKLENESVEPAVIEKVRKPRAPKEKLIELTSSDEKKEIKEKISKRRKSKDDNKTEEPKSPRKRSQSKPKEEISENEAQEKKPRTPKKPKQAELKSQEVVVEEANQKKPRKPRVPKQLEQKSEVETAEPIEEPKEKKPRKPRMPKEPKLVEEKVEIKSAGIEAKEKKPRKPKENSEKNEVESAEEKKPRKPRTPKEPKQAELKSQEVDVAEESKEKKPRKPRASKENNIEEISTTQEQNENKPRKPKSSKDVQSTESTDKDEVEKKPRKPRSPKISIEADKIEKIEETNNSIEEKKAKRARKESIISIQAEQNSEADSSKKKPRKPRMPLEPQVIIDRKSKETNSSEEIEKKPRKSRALNNASKVILDPTESPEGNESTESAPVNKRRKLNVDKDQVLAEETPRKQKETKLKESNETSEEKPKRQRKPKETKNEEIITPVDLIIKEKKPRVKMSNQVKDGNRE